MPQSRTAIVVTGGAPPRASALVGLPADAHVIAADSGLDNALAVGLKPMLVVGDLDSVSPSALAWARGMGIPIEEHPRGKDATDTELALLAAIDSGASDVVMLSGGGDRLDHSMGALIALGNPFLAACSSVAARWADALIHVLHGPRAIELTLPAGTTFSILALHGPCVGVGERGTEWPLTNALVSPGSSLGISNVTVSPAVHIEVGTGVLTIIIPFQYGESS